MYPKVNLMICLFKNKPMKTTKQAYDNKKELVIKVSSCDTIIKVLTEYIDTSVKHKEPLDVFQININHFRPSPGGLKPPSEKYSVSMMMVGDEVDEPLRVILQEFVTARTQHIENLKELGIEL